MADPRSVSSYEEVVHHAERASVSPDRPLLSLTIPTFNRYAFLAELLDALLPQIPQDGSVELLVSDNASTDATFEIVANFHSRGLPLRSVRNPENIGADANFLQCLSLARGKYVWVLGDDDLVLPKAVPQILSLLRQGEGLQQGEEQGSGGDFDLIYLSSTGFTGPFIQPPAAALSDRLGRFAEIVTDGAYFLEKVNALIGLISVVIVNKDRLSAAPHPPLTDLADSNLLQVGWIFPLLHTRCRVLYVWQRLVAYRHFNSGGWGICEVFGLRLHRIAHSYFAAEPRMATSLMNGLLRYWLPDVLMSMRQGRDQAMNAENFAHTLEPVFSHNWRYWIFVWTVAVPPLAVSRFAHRLIRLMNKATRAAQALLRHTLHPGPYLQPVPQEAQASAATSPAPQTPAEAKEPVQNTRSR